MGEAAAAAEGLLQRRIEFHGARNPHTAAVAAAAPGGFRMEMLRTDAEKRVAAARSEGGRRFEKGESSGNGFDPELAAARVYLRRIGAGLHNLGNTCYLNSVLQCLTYTEPFVAYLQSGKHKSSCRTTGFCALCALQNHVRSALQSTGKILKPVHFVNNLRCISRSFRNSRQEDAHELMVSLLESMHKCCLPSGIPSESPSAYEKSLVHRIFGGRLRSQVRCTRCSHCSNKYDPFLDLSLEIGNATTLMKALQNFTQEEVLDGGEKQYNCQRCKQKVVAKKRIIIDKAPSVLTIHLKRFSPFNPLLKIDKKVDFHPTLNLKPFVSNSEDMDLKYNLYGVLVHAGWNTQSGHYYCFVRTSSGIWHNLDDNQVHQVREADVLKQKAYMLFYVRDTVRSLGMHKNNSAATLSGKSVIPNMTFGEVKKLYGDMRLQKQSPPDSGQSSMVSNTPQDQCSSERSKSELIAESSQSNGPASVQNASCTHPDGAASLSAKMKHIASDCKSPGQPDTCILRDASCDQKEFEKPLQGLQPEPDDALTDSGKDVPAAVVPTGNGPDELLGATGQTTDSHTLRDANCDQKACEMPLQELQIGHECTDSGKDIPAAAIPICNDTDGLLGVTGQLTEPRTDPYCESSPDTCILRDVSCDQKPCEKTLHELQPEPDDTLTDSVKDIPAAAIPVCNGTGGLFGATGQPTEPQTNPLCRSSPDTDTAAIAQTIPSEDAIVSNGTVSSNEDSTIGNEAKEIEPVKQQDVLVVVEKLSVESIDGEGNAENQTSVQNNRLDDVKVMVNELSVMDTDHMDNAERTSVQNNALDIRQVNPERQISSEDSAQAVCSEDCAQVLCSENSVQVSDKDPCHGISHKKKDIKSKKHVRYQAVNLFFGSKQLLLGSLKPGNNRKRKRTKRRYKSSVDIESIANDQQASTSETVLTKGISCKSHRRKRSRNAASSEDGVQLLNKKQNLGDSSGAAELTEDKKDKDALLANDQQASTSETVLTEGISCKSHRRKHSRNTASSEDGVQLLNKKHNLGDSSGAAELTEDKKDKDALLACAELSSLCPSSVSNSDERKCVRANESGSRHFDILTRGLREITVPRWDGIGMPNNNVTELQYSRTTSIGYVLDGWDEEYDRGRRKKARKPTGNFSGPNPFQETANMRSRQRMRPEVELARTGHKPFRI